MEKYSKIFNFFFKRDEEEEESDQKVGQKIIFCEGSFEPQKTSLYILTTYEMKQGC